MSKTEKKFDWKTIAGLGGLTAIILLALVIPNSGLFQASVQQTAQIHGSAADCQKLDTITLPESPVPANTPAVIAINTTPETFPGPFTYAANSGSLNDGQGNVGSYIQSSSKKVNYSGGDDGSVVTIQAVGEANKNCLATVPVLKPTVVACESLRVVTDPNPLPQNQSAALTIAPSPQNFQGSYLFQADSGEFQMQEADVQANGNNTKTLVTRSTHVLYNGGKSGEKIVVKALGANNSKCIATVPITQ